MSEEDNLELQQIKEPVDELEPNEQFIPRVPPREILNNMNSWYRRLKFNIFTNPQILQKQKDTQKQMKLYCAQLKFNPQMEISRPEDTYTTQRLQSNFQIKCFATLFSALDMDYYGRTTESQKISLVTDPSNLKILRPSDIDLSFNDFQVFMITKKFNRDSFLVIDIALIEISVKQEQIYHQLGFVVLPLFQNYDPLIPMRYIYKGSPRLLNSLKPDSLYEEQIPQLKSIGKQINYRFLEVNDKQQIKKFISIAQLISDSQIFSCEDYFPGIVGNRFPQKILRMPFRMNQGLKKTLYVYRLRMVFEGISETDIIVRLKQRAQKLLQLPVNSKIQIQIEERRVIIFAHNTWRQIGKELDLNLQEPVDNVGQGVQVLYAGANIQLSDFVIDPQIATVFKIYYSTRIIVNDTRVFKDTFNFANFIYLPTLITQKQYDDIVDEIFTQEVYLNHEQTQFFGDVSYFHPSKQPVKAVLQAIISTKVSAATNLDIANLRVQVDKSKKRSEEEQILSEIPSDQFRIQVQNELLIRRQLQGDLIYQKQEQGRQIEEIEKLKFKQDVKTGLTYFDKVQEIVKQGEKEVEDLKQQYENNLNKLIQITNQDEFKEKINNLSENKIIVEKIEQERSKYEDHLKRISEQNQELLDEMEIEKSTEMTRQQTLAFIRLGHLQMFNHNFSERSEIKLQRELNDAQRKSKYQITILGFEGEQNPGSKLLIRLKFFTRTSQQQLGRLIIQKNTSNVYRKHEKSLFWIRQFDFDTKIQNNMTFTYDIDCIHERDMSDFFKYMYQGFLQVEIFDYHTLFQIATGSCNVITSLRQGKEYQVVGYSLKMRDFNQKLLGNLFIMVENIGQFIPQDYIDEANRIHSNQEEKKKVYSKANDEMFHHSLVDTFIDDHDFDKENMDESERKRLRVQRFMKSGASLIQPLKVEANNIEKELQLKEFMSSKQLNQSKVALEKLNQAILKHKSIDVRQGEPSFYILEIKNPYEADEIFTVEIKDEVIISLDLEPEVKIITDINELKFWVSKGFYHQIDLQQLADEYSEIFLSEGRMFLKKRQSIRLLIKILTSRESKCQEQEGLIEDVNYFGKRIVQLTVYHQNKDVYTISNIEIVPRYQNYEVLELKDHYIQADKKNEILLIKNFSRRISSINAELDKDLQQKYTFKSNLNANILYNEQENLRIKFTSSNHVGKVYDIFIFVYEKQDFLFQPLHIYKFSLQSALFLKPNMKLGKESVIDLDLNRKKGKLRLLKMSEKMMLQNNINLMIDPNEDDKYYLNLVSLGDKLIKNPDGSHQDFETQNKTRFYLNLVDNKTKAVKYPIIVEPHFKRPKIDRYIEIKLHENQDAFKLKIKNPFINTRICSLLVQDIEVIQCYQTMAIADKKNMIEFKFRVITQQRNKIETVISIVPLFLGYGDSMNFFIKIAPIQYN
ncbi:UNKNOWN [Stylonychia lemnae]|uniref:Nephrocystin-4 n=1 Tax=Stylonychia lemnae TaxID=5949 RepID=A0A078B712_STYLE|nr:UNKNOWN [Stylonychia lemnae]|eukprot:CDW89092.1 UNKNOWN [Stylonychia lemnae]